MNWIGRFLVKILVGTTEEYVTKVQTLKSQLLRQEVHQEENLPELKKKLKMKHQRKGKYFELKIHPRHPKFPLIPYKLNPNLQHHTAFKRSQEDRNSKENTIRSNCEDSSSRWLRCFVQFSFIFR